LFYEVYRSREQLCLLMFIVTFLHRRDFVVTNLGTNVFIVSKFDYLVFQSEDVNLYIAGYPIQ